MNKLTIAFLLLLPAFPRPALASPYDSVPTKRISCGGGPYTDSQNHVFSADAAYGGPSSMGYVTAGSAASTPNSISGTPDPTLYQTSRTGNIEYDFDLPVGVYDVTLKFAETSLTQAGQRKFRVYFQNVGTSSGTRVLDDFDIFAAAGGQNTAVDKKITNFAVSEGKLRINFTSNYPGGANFPAVCAIAVESTTYSIGDTGMSDDAFINMVEYKAFRWFYDNVSAPYYLCADVGAHDGTDVVDYTNISGPGDQIIVYCIGAYRGWMTNDEAYTRVKGILQGIQLMKKGDYPYANPYETYWHYMDRLNPAVPIPARDSVRSIYDNGNLMMGVVFAQEYFKGTDIDLMARQIFESLDWNKFGDYTHPYYSEEMIAVMLGASSPRASCRNASMIAGFSNASATDLTVPLYFYQWFNNLFDGRVTRTPGGRNDFQYSVNASEQNRNGCIGQWQSDPGGNNTYDWDCWGKSASFRANGYGMNDNGGDVNPFAVPASMPFAPTETLNAMKHMYFRYYKNGYPEYLGPIWSDKYGFCQTYNIGSSASSPYFKYSYNACFDFAFEVIGIENYRSGFVWQHVMNSDYIKAGMYRIGMTGYTTPPVLNLAENKPANASSSMQLNVSTNAFDDDLLTCWESQWTYTPQWISVDLQAAYAVNTVELLWGDEYAKSYKLQVSMDNVSWTDVVTATGGSGGADIRNLAAGTNARYVRVYCTEKAVPDEGYSLWGVRVIGGSANALSTVDSASADIKYNSDTTLTLRSEYGDISLLVPAYTFGTNLTLTMSKSDAPRPDVPEIKVSGVCVNITNDKNLQPSGGVTITMKYRDSDLAPGMDASKLEIAYYNEATGHWMWIPSTAYPSDRKVVGTASHLSKFAIVQYSVASDLSQVKAYPVPYFPSKGVMTVSGLTRSASIKIYDITGVLIKNLDYSLADGRAAWDGTNDSGNKVASGIYIVAVNSPQGGKKFKIAVEK